MTREVKKIEISTLDELHDLILNSPIEPKPIVKSMLFTWDWRSFIEPHLNPLENHSFFNSFNFRKEEGLVRLRYKKWPHSPEYGPVMGIQLLKPGISLTPVLPADFRIESLYLDKLLRGLQPYFNTLSLERQMYVVTSWGALKKTLESLPLKVDSMRRMDLSRLPRQDNQEPVTGGDIDEEENGRQIRGTFFEDQVDDGDLEEEMAVDLDVCVYTKSKIKRPWVGRVTAVVDRESFVMNWFEKEAGDKGGKYIAMKNEDGSLYVTELDVSSVMFWAFTESRGEESFVISAYWQDCLRRKYREMDEALI